MSLTFGGLLIEMLYSFGIFRLTDPPGLQTILTCNAKEAFHPHPDVPIYTVSAPSWFDFELSAYVWCVLRMRIKGMYRCATWLWRLSTYVVVGSDRTALLAPALYAHVPLFCNRLHILGSYCHAACILYFIYITFHWRIFSIPRTFLLFCTDTVVRLYIAIPWITLDALNCSYYNGRK